MRNKNYLSELQIAFNQDFRNWLIFNNLIDTVDYEFYSIRENILRKILDILILNPDANTFWFNSSDQIEWCIKGSDDTIRGDAITINSRRVKGLLRDIKIDKLIE